MRFNADYANIFKEPPLMLMAIVRHALLTKPEQTPDAQLLVNASLIGEFAASAPALSAYLASQHGPVDLLVSPPLRPLAERMRGVRKVYVASSVFARTVEREAEPSQLFDTYKTIRVMRISTQVYRILGALQSVQLKTSLPQLGGYGLHLFYCWLTRHTPRSWREVNFAMLGLVPRTVTLEEIFNFTEDDFASVKSFPALQGSAKKLFIHTGASWPGNKWPLLRWVELLKRIHAASGITIVFVGSTSEQAEYRAIAAQLPFETYSLAGALNLRELLLALCAADYFIGVDSGPRNVAHLAGLPSITLLSHGPHMYTPERGRDIVLDHSRGRGLYQRFFETKKNRYIDKISAEEVFAAFKKLSG